MKPLAPNWNFTSHFQDIITFVFVSNLRLISLEFINKNEGPTNQIIYVQILPLYKFLEEINVLILLYPVSNINIYFIFNGLQIYLPTVYIVSIPIAFLPYLNS